MKYVLILFVCFLGAISHADVECPKNYPSGNTLTYPSGAMNYPNGNTFRYPNGAMNYPNGNTLRYASSAMNFENGNTLMYPNGPMNYPNGNTLRYSNGSLNDPNGSTNQTGSITLSTNFGDTQMRIFVKSNSAKFQTTIPFGKGIMIVDFDDKGNVTCAVEGGEGPSEFKLDGIRGSAYVTVKPGQDINAVKQAVQKALDGK